MANRIKLNGTTANSFTIGLNGVTLNTANVGPYQLNLPANTGSNNQVLATDGTGNLTWSNSVISANTANIANSITSANLPTLPLPIPDMGFYVQIGTGTSPTTPYRTLDTELSWSKTLKRLNLGNSSIANANVITANAGTFGNLTVNGNATIQGNLLDVDSVRFDTANAPATVSVGQLSWNDGDGTLDLGLKGGNVILQIGEKLVARVYNDDSVTLTSGMMVQIVGAQGNRISVRRAQANNETNSVHTLGMVTESIDVGSEGFITTVGTVNKLNTTGLTAGQTLYLSPSVLGGYTATKPVAPDQLVTIGFVERVSSTVGSIYIKVDNGYELEELHDVLIANAVNGQSLIYANGLWVNGNANIANIAYSVNVANVSGIGNIATINLNGNGSQVLAGNGSWVAQSGGGNTSSISNGNSNVSIAAAGANVTTSVNGNTNILVVTGTGVNVAGTFQSTSNTYFEGDVQANGNSFSNNLTIQSATGYSGSNSTTIMTFNPTSVDVTTTTIYHPNASTNYPSQVVTRSRGTSGIPTSAVNNDRINSRSFRAYNGSSNTTAAFEHVIVSNVNSNSNSVYSGGEWRMFTGNPNGSNLANSTDQSGLNSIRLLNNGSFQILQGTPATSNSSALQITNFGASSSDLVRVGGIFHRRARGNNQTQLSVQPNDQLGRTSYAGYNGTSYYETVTGQLRAVVDSSYVANSANIPVNMQIVACDDIGNQKTTTFYGNGNVNIEGRIFTTGADLSNVGNVTITGGSNGQYLRTDGAGNLTWATVSGGSGSPGGSNTQLQFNDNGSFGGIANVTYNGSNLSLGNISNVKLNGGVNNEVIRTDGNGNLSFTSIALNLLVGTRTGPETIPINNYTFQVETRSSGNVTVYVN